MKFNDAFANFKYQKHRKQLLLLISFFLFCFISCTENPFWKEDKITGNSVRGKVSLNSYLSPDEVYVWFKALDLSTRTDKNGDFTLHFPPPNKQPGGGIDGIYDIYFFVANYQLQSVQVAFIKGDVQYSEEYLNSEGELKKPVVLYEMLKIKTSFGPTMHTEDLEDSIHVSFTVNTVVETIPIMTIFSNPLDQNDPESLAGFLLNSDKNVVKMFPQNRTFMSVEIKADTNPKTLTPLIAIIRPGEFPSGEYYIIPYFVIQHKDLPAGLLKSIGNNLTRYSPDYLKIPMKIRNNKFNISN